VKDAETIIYEIDGGGLTDLKCDICGGELMLDRQVLNLIGGGLYRVKNDLFFCSDCERETVTTR